MSCPCNNNNNNNNNNNISQGINDNRNSISILTTRIFDNVRIDLDRTEVLLETDITPTAITAIYAGGTGSFVPDSDVTVTPHINDNYADVCGTLHLSGTVTYIYGGTRQTAPARLLIPINAQMAIPEDSIWPFDITVHFSYFADNLTENETNRFSALVDGVVIVYITACVPVCLNSFSPVRYNSLSERTVINNNNFTSSVFYPRTHEITASDCTSL